MAMKIRFTNLAEPIITCDMCQKVIEKAEDGHYAFNADDADLKKDTPIFFTHKKACIEKLMDYFRRHEMMFADHPLDDLPIYLINTLDIDVERRKEMMV